MLILLFVHFTMLSHGSLFLFIYKSRATNYANPFPCFIDSDGDVQIAHEPFLNEKYYLSFRTL